MTIYGLGGCGKSALAIEFAYRALARRAELMVFWVPAITQESFERAYREIGLALRIPGITDNNANIWGLVKETLSSGSVCDWLMIVDNADDPGVLSSTTNIGPVSARLSDCLPHGNRGTILYTTRSRKVAGDLTQSNVLELNDPSKAEAKQLLARRLRKQALLDEEVALDELLETLSYLPLAIVQAAAFINNNDISISEYMSLFRRTGSEIELFNEHFEDPSRYREMDSTISKTWHISFNQIRKQDRLAADYLSFMACIDRINIPQSILPPGGSLVQRVKAIGTLTGYAFITERQQAVQKSEKERFFDMHRLVHMASHWWLEGHGERAAWTGTAVGRLEDLVPYGGHEKKKSWTVYLSHALYVAGPGSSVDETARASLLTRVGECQESLGQYTAAETTKREGLALREKVLGLEHPDTLVCMNNLGVVLDNQGKYEEAEALNRQTLQLRMKVLGHEHPDTLKSLSNLTAVLDSQGNYKEAETLNRQTLRLRKTVLGPEHPDTLKSMNNLSLVLGNQAKYREAEALSRQTLALKKKVLGPEDFGTLISMSNLTAVLGSQGKYEEAETLNRQTLRLRKKVLGPEHPDTLMSMNNLALVLGNQGKYEQAEGLSRQTLALRRRVLGAEHPSTLISMSNLALVLDDQSKYDEAESLHRQGLAIREKILGRNHPETLMSVYGLAYHLSDQRCWNESIALYERACAAFHTVFGDDHPTTRACRRHYTEAKMEAREEQRLASPASTIVESSESMHTAKAYKFARWLAKAV